MGINFSGSTGGKLSDFTGGGAGVLSDIAALRALEPDGVDDPEVVIVQGWLAADDGGGGSFYWDSAATDADDSTIVFKPTSAGATGRWFRVTEDRLVNVKWSGDTSSDLSGPFNLAIAAAETHGMEGVYIPPGAYSTPSRLNIVSRSNMRIVGHGATITQATNVTITFFVSSCTNITIEGVKQIGKRTDYAAATSEARGVSIHDSSFITIRDCELTWNSHADILFTNSDDIAILNNKIIGTGLRSPADNDEFGVMGYLAGLNHSNIQITGNDISATSEGIYLGSDFNYVTITDNRIYDIDGEHGMYLTGLSHGVISNNVIKNVDGQGIKQQLDGPAVTFEAAQSNVYDGNTIDGCGSWGIALAYGGTSPGAGIEHFDTVVTNNTIANTVGGITVRRFERAIISGNTIYESTLAGIHLEEGTGGLVQNNRIEGTDREGFYANIASGDKHVYTGNWLKSVGRLAPASNADFGWQLVGAGSAEIHRNIMELGTSTPRYPIIALSTPVSLFDNIFPTTITTRAGSITAAEGNIHGGWYSYSAGTLIPGRARGRVYSDNAAPSSGTYQLGDIVWNDTPTAGGVLMWICTSAGAPGVWKSVAIAA